VLALALLAALAIGGCGADTSPLAKHRAEELVAATEAAGVAQNLTVENAEALYGRSADSVCEVFNGSDDELNLPGNPAGNHYRVFTEEAVEYTRLVVKTYCPDRLDNFEDAVDELEIAGSSR